MKIKLLELNMLVALVLSATIASADTPLLTDSKELMGTFVKIDVCVSDEKKEDHAQALVQIWDRLGDIHSRMSIYDQTSDVWSVNRSYENPTAIGADTYKLIEDSIAMSQLTMGAFDITVWPLIHFWRDRAKLGEFPKSSHVKKVLESIGSENIIMHENNKVEIKHADTRIDLGGIAKGYAIDEAVRTLRKFGFDNFLVDAGGDLRVGDKNCQGEEWSIGIRDPRNSTALIRVVKLSDEALTTSGDYEQFMIIADQKFSHIINPLTGYPQKGVVSASVIAPTAQEADALSTAATVLGGTKFVQLIDSMSEEYAALVFSSHDGKDLQTKESQSFMK